ncbi:uncharacterized protein MICPUCDRAFT_29100 [Micromonas pusilla CCMP1545]|uniref:DNA helicase n=1 Tax=Micromonas pusilla (strain CCMP1545) TaxID=564608 RepID=C1N2Y8_MICPC|nr:uncharacterized protein MICPUCDRAFT_29100 [Micromonas pusilla CCMP1545]EEH53335.1 predicted protein [Micromonas pusilla CCMP1545]|eukprot:XP_003062516.1 predicted protein [Micromonas pusilla CCMP1545]
MTLERDAEVEQSEGALREMSPATAAKRGRALLGLKIVDARGGLLGKTVLTFESSKRPTAAAPPLPPHKFTPHDVVCVRPSKGVGGGEPIAAGVVYRVKDTAIEVAVDDAPDSDGVDQAVRLEKLSNETTHKRLRAALERLGSAPRGGGGAASGSGPGGGGAYGRVVDVMFGKTPPRFAKRDAADDGFARFFNPRLDASQKDAVAHALRAVDLALIHGPPGTGKTTVVVEYVAREVARGARILCCAASNVAVDNLVERLARITRLGHPARLLASVLENSLEAQVLRSDNSSLARDCERESAALRRRLLKLADAKTREGAFSLELRRLAKETRARQRLAVDEVVASANVVCCTLAGALGGVLKDQARSTFDVVVIDEAAQALEASCWGAIMRGGKVVLAGDHLQLPPTVLSDVAAREGLSETLFQRAHAKWYRENVAVMLTTQYRMHEDIMRRVLWASNAMYDGALLASEDARGRTLRSASGAPLGALQLVDTAGCDCDERQEEEGASRDNPGEAAVAMRIVADLISSGAVAADDVGIITPYSAQVGTLRDLRAANDALFKGVEISTVDGFQGREKEAIVISAVRSNDRGDVGFLSDARRMNVAVTRARARCVLVCDTETIARKDAFLAGLVKHFETRGEYISAAELQED